MGTTDIGNPALGATLNNLLTNEGGTGFLSRLLSVGVTGLLIVGAIYFIFMLLTGGVDWIRSGADKASLEEARGRLSSAFIGLFLLFSSFAVISLLEGVFCVRLLTFHVPTLENVGQTFSGGCEATPPYDDPDVPGPF